MLKDMDFYNFLENIKNSYWILDQVLEKLLPKKQSIKQANFQETKIADAVTKPNDYKIVKQEHIEEIIIPLEKKR